MLRLLLRSFIWSIPLSLVTHAFASDPGDDSTYLIMSLPVLRQVAYAKLPDNVLRILVPVTEGLVAPKGICLDNANSRLYVTDSPTMRIVWYQLISLPDGKLITDGRQHIAVKSVASSWCTVDGVGNLYFSGKLIDPLGLPTKECIYKYDAINIVTEANIWPTIVWSPSNSGSDPSVLAPSGVATDLFTAFWGNKEGGETNGTVCRGSVTPPAINPVSVKVANNKSGSRGLTLTERYLFYATQKAIYGLKKERTSQGCEKEDDCVLISEDVTNANGIAWDSDGTVYVADTGRVSETGVTGAVMSFPSGNLAHHPLNLVIEAQGVHDVAILMIPAAGTKKYKEMTTSGASDYHLSSNWLLIIALLFAL